MMKCVYDKGSESDTGGPCLMMPTTSSTRACCCAILFPARIFCISLAAAPLFSLFSLSSGGEAGERMGSVSLMLGVRVKQVR